ncbi:MAG: prenyltransferase [Spirochaetaceae bacterium]|nr:MAG: prenyltransferase [Spirochaetaceae bacterium]
MERFLRIVEIRTKVVSVSALLLGTGFAAWETGAFDLTLFVLMALATLLVDMGTTAFNSYFDFTGGVDTAAYNKEQDKVLVHQKDVHPLQAFLIGAACFVLAMPIGLVIGYLAGWEIIVVGAACMAVGYLYNGGPLPLSRTPLGELFAGGFLGGVLLLLSYYVQTGSLSLDSLLIAIPSLLMVASILTVNNTCDVEGDRAAGRKTLSIVFGPTIGAGIIYALGAASFGLLAVYSVAGILPTVPGLVTVAILTPPVFLRYRRMHRRGFNHETKGPSMGAILSIFKLYTVGFAAILAIGLILPSI